MWATWHLPSFFVAGSGGAAATGVNLPLIALQLLVLSLFAIAIRVVVIWIFNAAGAAVPLIMLGHSALDQAPSLVSQLKVPRLSGDSLDYVSYLSMAACAVIIITVTRGRLGYERARTSQEEHVDRVIQAAVVDD